MLASVAYNNTLRGVTKKAAELGATQLQLLTPGIAYRCSAPAAKE